MAGRPTGSRFRNVHTGVVVTAAEGLTLGRGWEAVTEGAKPARTESRSTEKRTTKRTAAPVRASSDDD